jgi:ribosomal protein S18 acetylase RimI-like enzyme
MVFDLAHEMPDGAANGDVEIRQIVDATGVNDFVALGDAAFGRSHGAKAETYVRSLGDPALALYVAYRDGRPVSAGRLQMQEGRSFASMWGGGTAPEHQHHGFYRALVAHRAREARRRGYRYLTVDAASTSRAILQRLGFTPLIAITGFVLRP